jgi:hypothetical protein
MSHLDIELQMAAALVNLREKGWTIPVYDEHGQRDEHNGQTRYTLSPTGLQETAKQHPDMSFTPEHYAQAQEMLDRALRFDLETRARFGDQT